MRLIGMRSVENIGENGNMSCENCKWDNPEEGVCYSLNPLCHKEGRAPDGSFWCHEVQSSASKANMEVRE